MVGLESELPANEEAPEMVREFYHGKQLMACHTVALFLPTEGSACVGDHLLSPIWLELGQHCSNPHITRVNVQNEGVRVVRIDQYRR